MAWDDDEEEWIPVYYRVGQQVITVPLEDIGRCETITLFAYGGDWISYQFHEDALSEHCGWRPDEAAYKVRTNGGISNWSACEGGAEPEPNCPDFFEWFSWDASSEWGDDDDDFKLLAEQCHTTISNLGSRITCRTPIPWESNATIAGLTIKTILGKIHIVHASG